MSATEPIKVSAATHRLIRLAATMNECSMAAVVDEAVAEFLAVHADEIEAGLAHARSVLVPVAVSSPDPVSKEDS